MSQANLVFPPENLKYVSHYFDVLRPLAGEPELLKNVPYSNFYFQVHYERDHNEVWPTNAAKQKKIMRKIDVPTNGEMMAFRRTHSETLPNQLKITKEKLLKVTAK